MRFRDQRRRVALDPAQLVSLGTEFAEEDRALAELSMTDYATMLVQEDQR